MRRTVLLTLTSLVALAAFAPPVSAQDTIRYRRDGGFTINVRPRSFLDAGNVVQPYSSVNPASAYGQAVSYLANPPYNNRRGLGGSETLPDPITNGPFPGSYSPFDPVDYGTYNWVR